MLSVKQYTFVLILSLVDDALNVSFIFAGEPDHVAGGFFDLFDAFNLLSAGCILNYDRLGRGNAEESFEL
jgi:hypothetical protein